MWKYYSRSCEKRFYFLTDKKAAGKVKSKNKLKLAFGGKNKEEKKEMKREEKLDKAAKVSIHSQIYVYII